MTLNNLKDKKIIILGLGKEGIDSFKFLRKLFPQKKLGIGDRLEFDKLDKKAQGLLKENKKVNLCLGKNYLKSLGKYDIILKAPGIPFHLKGIEKFKGKITSQAEIFLENCPGKVIGITGTKGKSTTASLIYAILKEAGFKAHLVGNIGKPVLSLLLNAKEDDIFVYELSSHQLFGISLSPHVAVFLNVYPEHLDYYKNFKEYALSKGNITKFQESSDYLVFNKEDEIVSEIIKKSKAQKVPLNSIRLGRILKTRDVPLKGKFNLLNVKAAVAVAKILNVPDKKTAGAIKKFKPLHHRLEFVGEWKGIKFYNDALSTIPEATIAALEALGSNVRTIMLGGFERNIDFKNLAKEILRSKVETVILFPTTGQRIWKEIEKEGKNKKLPTKFFVKDMKKAVKISFERTKKGKICLLSTASPSFSVFKDYKEKGDLFKKYIKIFGHEKKS